jgi:uncharacterized protein (DUF1015 family)
MLKTQPFRALRPNPAVAKDLASVPYDVVNTEEARALARGNPKSFLHVVRSEIDLPVGTDPHADAVYDKARENFTRLIEQGDLVRDTQASYYLYRQSMVLLGKRVTQVGVVCSCSVADYEANVIKKHEKTRKDKEDDRTRHVLSINANAGPVFLLFKDDPELARLIELGTQSTPLYDFEAVDGVRHTVWRAPDGAALQQAFAKLSAAYVADGHHRSASAARAGKELASKNPNHSGDEEYNWFLACLFPASALTILPYHRIVKDLNDLSVAEFLDKLRKVASLESTTEAEPNAPGSVGVYIGGKWYMARFPESAYDRSDAIRSLDYVVLYEQVLAPILGIGDVRTDNRIDFVGGIRGTQELEKRVNQGDAEVAFAMHATTIEQLIRVADQGAIMPPKSTWFEPKLRSGLLVHTLD